MATQWIKIEMTTPDKPEVVLIASILRMDQDAVLGKLLRIWLWADQNSVAGDNVEITAAFLDRMTKKRGFATAMRKAGWLAGVDGALTFPGFARHNGSTAKGRALQNRRKDEQRERDKSVTKTGQKRDNAVTKPGPDEDEEKEALAPLVLGAGAREASRSLPSSLDTPQFREAWDGWLQHWSANFNRGKSVPLATADAHLKLLAPLDSPRAITWLANAISRGLREPSEPFGEPKNANDGTRNQRGFEQRNDYSKLG